MDIDKIINNSIEKEKNKISINENLFDKNWILIQQKIDAQSRKKQNKRTMYFKELAAVAAFTAILILIPTATQYYRDKYGKLPKDNPAVITQILKTEDYDKTLSEINVKSDYKEQKRVEALVSRIAKKQYDDFLVSYQGITTLKIYGDNSGVIYHKVGVGEISKGKIPSYIYYYVKDNTDEVYYVDSKIGVDKVDIIKVQEGSTIKINQRFSGTDNLQVQLPLLVGKNVQFHMVDLEEYKNIVDIQKYHNIYEDDKKKIAYVVSDVNGDIYELDKNNGKLKLTYKNQLNNDKVTKKLSEDIDGDGRQDEIKFDCYNNALTVNDNTIAMDSYFQTDKISVVDINKKDSLKEIVIEEAAPSDMHFTNYYYFNGKTFVGYHHVDGFNISTDGSGSFFTKDARGHILETWYHDMEYKQTKNFGFEEVPKEMYPLQQKLKVKHALQLQKSKTDKEIVSTLKEGEEVSLIGCDDKAWCCVKDSKGIVGWFEVERFNVIKSVNLRTDEVFDGLIMVS